MTAAHLDRSFVATGGAATSSPPRSARAHPATRPGGCATSPPPSTSPRPARPRGATAEASWSPPGATPRWPCGGSHPAWRPPCTTTAPGARPWSSTAATGTSASPSWTVAPCSTPPSGWSPATPCGGSTRPATSTANRPPKVARPSWCSSRRPVERPPSSSRSTCPAPWPRRCSPPTADAASPRCGSTTPRTCSSTSTCRPGASRSPDARRSRSCSTATSWACPTCGCARSGPCRPSTAASSRSRSAPAAAPRPCSGATSTCCACGTGRWPSTSPTARALGRRRDRRAGRRGADGAAVNDLLERVTDRVPIDGHDGRSGAHLERGVLDGRRVIVKTVDPGADLSLLLGGDPSGRERRLWADGVLDRLPPGTGHALIAAGWTDGRLVTVMRDLGAAVLSWDRRITPAELRRLFDGLAGVHQRVRRAAAGGPLRPGDPPHPLRPRRPRGTRRALRPDRRRAARLGVLRRARPRRGRRRGLRHPPRPGGPRRDARRGPADPLPRRRLAGRTWP